MPCLRAVRYIRLRWKTGGLAQTDPRFAAEYRARFLQPRRERARAIFRRQSAARIRAATEVETAIDALYGPLYHRLLHGRARLDERFVRYVVDIVLDGIMSRST